jgi:hypothetical protein
MRYYIARLLERWKTLVGGAFLIVGIFTDDVGACAVGLYLLLSDRSDMAREYLDLQVLEMETRLASGSTRVWVRKEN